MSDAWERVSEKDYVTTERLKVKGGWLYLTIVAAQTDHNQPTIAMAFVPDTED